MATGRRLEQEERRSDPAAISMKQQYTITSLPPSPEAERKARMVKYTITMSIRVLCIFLMLFVQGTWWLWVFAAGAVFLPYVAVVLANVGTTRGEQVATPIGAIGPGAQVVDGVPSTSDADAPGEASARDAHRDPQGDRAGRPEADR